MVTQANAEESQAYEAVGSVENQGEQGNIAGKVARDQRSETHETSINGPNVTISGEKVEVKSVSETRASSEDAACSPAEESQLAEVKKKRIAFAISGKLDEVDRIELEAIAGLLRQMTGDIRIKIIDVEEGSIKIILEGSEEVERETDRFSDDRYRRMMDTAYLYATGGAVIAGLIGGVRVGFIGMAIGAAIGAFVV